MNGEIPPRLWMAYQYILVMGEEKPSFCKKESCAGAGCSNEWGPLDLHRERSLSH